MAKVKIIMSGKPKKYFQLRICWMCDEQKMVNLDGICKKCAEPKKE